MIDKPSTPPAGTTLQDLWLQNEAWRQYASLPLDLEEHGFVAGNCPEIAVMNLAAVIHTLVEAEEAGGGTWTDGDNGVMLILNEAARIAIEVSKHMDSRRDLVRQEMKRTHERLEAEKERRQQALHRDPEYQEVLRDIVLSSREMSKVQEAKLNDIARRFELANRLQTIQAAEGGTDHG